MSSADIKSVISFRSRGRIPAVTWMHPCGAVLARSSQPGVGLATRRCVADEKLVELYRRCGQAKTIYVVDARARIAVGG